MGARNYQTFKAQTRLYLRASELDWWLDHIPDGSSEQRISHARAMSHYYSNVEGDILHYFITAKSTKEIAERLEEQYGAQENKSNLIMLQKQLNNMKMVDTTDNGMEKFIQGSRKVYNEMINYGSQITSEDYISRLLAAIPEEYIYMEGMLMMIEFKSIEVAEHALRAQFRIINHKRSSVNITQGSYPKGKRTEKKCFHCGKPGHFKERCYKWKREQSGFQKKSTKKPISSRDNTSNDEKEKRVTFATVEVLGGEDPVVYSTDQKEHVEFILDSGANTHVCKDKWAFASITNDIGKLRGTGGECETIGHGSINITTDTGIKLCIVGVKYAPTADVNILSLSRFVGTTNGKVTMHKDGMQLRTKDMLVMEGKLKNGLYTTKCKISN